MHIDEDFTQLPVRVFTCPKIDFVPSDDAFLGISVPSVRQLVLPILLEQLLRVSSCKLVNSVVVLFPLSGAVFEIVVHSKGGCQRLAQLGAISIKSDSLYALAPSRFISIRAFHDCRTSGHVNGFGYRSAQEALSGCHHSDMALDVETALSLGPASVRAVKDRKIRFTEMRRPLQRHRAANVLVGRTYLI